MAPAHRPLPRHGGRANETACAALGRAGRAGPAYLSPHHLEAARRVESLFARARLQPRVTHSWDPTPKGPRGASGAMSLTDAAADARKELARLHDVLPADCAGVVIDVCGFEKGLQTVETERGWPRRSAKLVLRIALDRLADHFGLNRSATGPRRGAIGSWQKEGGQPQEWG